MAHALDAALAAIAVLQGEVAALKAAAAPPAPQPNVVEGASFNADPNKPTPPGTYSEPGTGLLRHAFGPRRGQVFNIDADDRPYLERRLAAVAERKADDAALLAAMRADLPAGCIKTWDGLIRDDRSGKVREDLLPATYAPPQTELSPPTPLLAPHPEQIHAGQSPDAMTDEVAELMRLRRPDPPVVSRDAERFDWIPTFAQIDEVPDPISRPILTRGAA